MQYTLRAKIHDPSVSLVLKDMGKHLSRSKMKFFVRYGVLGERLKDLKKEFIAKEGITARQFNAIAFEVKGLLSAQKEIKKNLIKKTQRKTQKIREKIKKSKTPFKTHQFKRQLKQKQEKLIQYEKQLKKPSVCFGEKEFFQKQFRLKENGYKSHEEWKSEWLRTREGNFFLIGSKDESFGNQSCQFLPGHLKLRLTHTLAEKYEKEWIEIPIEFTYEQEKLNAALASGQALHFRFLNHKNDFWYVHLSFDLPEVERVTDKKYGAIGVDLNPDCVAMSEIDPNGNLIHSWQVPIHLEGKRSEQIAAIIQDECCKIVQYAKEQKRPIVIEELDFENKKQQLRSRKMNRMLSQFCYSQFSESMNSRCYREGVECEEVNPAYSSTIGKVKFSLGYGLSMHMSAAMVIARRSLNFGESLRVKSKFRFALPDRNRAKHVWADWRRINPRVFPENYLWKNRQCPEHPQSEKSSSTARVRDLSRIRKSPECEVATSAQADAKFPHANRQAYCSPGVLE